MRVLLGIIVMLVVVGIFFLVGNLIQKKDLDNNGLVSISSQMKNYSVDLNDQGELLKVLDDLQFFTKDVGYMDNQDTPREQLKWTKVNKLEIVFVDDVQRFDAVSKKDGEITSSASIRFRDGVARMIIHISPSLMTSESREIFVSQRLYSAIRYFQLWDTLDKDKRLEQNYEKLLDMSKRQVKFVKIYEK